MDSQLDPLVGRENELERVVQILCRRTKNNPVLIGEPGVGKTAIVEGLAQRIADGEVPSFLADKRILALDLSLIVAGTKYRGQFEERLKTIMRELMESQNCIIFIDELHTLVGAGSAGRVARCCQYPEAGAFPRRDSVHWRNYARRISEVDRKGSVAGTAFPGGEGSASERGRRDQDSVRNQGPLRKVSCGHLHGRGAQLRSRIRTATFLIVSCRTRQST